MTFVYNPLFVVLSVLVAIQAAYVGLSLSQSIRFADVPKRRLLIAGSATALAVGIWGMHFIGMLAIVNSGSFNYAVLPTLISFLVCVLATGIAVFLASSRLERPPVLAALAMGLGISAMHYIGMYALHPGLKMEHDPFLVLESLVVAVAASGLAMWLSFSPRRKPSKFLSSVVLGAAISGMHYVAMAGATWHPLSALPEATGEAFSSNMLAIIVSIIAFLVSGVFMLALIPAGSKDDFKAEATDHLETPPLTQNETLNPTDQLKGEQIDPGRLDDTIPIEKHGTRLHLNCHEIVCVKADAHYTSIFNGNKDIFCPLPISDLETRLAGRRFFRTHRSHIVNLAMVSAFKKDGDAGVVELNTPVPRSVPVSRGRIAALRRELLNGPTNTGP